MEDENTLEYTSDLITQLREMTDIGITSVVYGETGKVQLIKSQYPTLKVFDSREFIESRNLGGFYLVKDGVIQYAQGILSDAMRFGAQICFKKIDSNTTLLPYLRPILNERQFIGNDGTLIKAHPSFRLFLTASEPFQLQNAVFVGPVRFTRECVMPFFGEMRNPIEKALDFVYSHASPKCMAEHCSYCEFVCLKEEFSCKCDNFLCSGHFRILCDLKEFIRNLKEDGPIDGSNTNRCVLYQAIVTRVLKHDTPLLSEYLYVQRPSLTLPNMKFAKTEPTESTLRSLICNIKCSKPTLLVGETGAGKTAIIQYLCLNSEYFFGKQVSMKVINMSSDFDGSSLIGSYHSIDFDKEIKRLYKKAQVEMPMNLNRRVSLEALMSLSDKHADVIEEAKLYLKILGKKLAFCYREGILTEAMRNGTWLLIDEINLAPKETLCLIEAMLSKKEIILYESGNVQPMKIHENFMVFACMNPFGDYGKKKYDSCIFNSLIFYDFSYSLKCIRSVVLGVSRNMLGCVNEISEFYFEFKKALGAKQYSNIIEPLITGRTLCRAINLILDLRQSGDEFAIFHAFSLLFFTQLDLSSRARGIELFKKYFPKGVPAVIVQSGVAAPFRGMKDNTSKDMKGNTLRDMKDNTSKDMKDNTFIITPKVRMHMEDTELAIKSNLPVLLQGDTSTGKTSLVFALAHKYGRRVIRINNHEHTDAADYLGNYTTSKDGIIFKKGALLTALTNGYWLILDELNLAPSDVMEVLNRLLDDNREVYVPETDELIKPHPHFRIFATQNINYGGRRGLAKSFRNRFIEIFFYEKDENELREILGERCNLPSGFTKLMITIYSRLRVVRSVNSLITLRDLFKWARRGPCSYYEVFEIGLDVLSLRLRSQEDIKHINGVFNEVFGDRMNIEKKAYLSIYSNRYTYTSLANQDDNCELDLLNNGPFNDMGNQVPNNIYNSGFIFNNISVFYFQSVTADLIITKSYIKLIDAIYRAWLCYEPVLIIGETGIGKTKMCEIAAKIFKIKLKTINMHSGTESSDFIGHSMLNRGEISWKDGVLVQAISNGEGLLIDEINLAEDAVLERMNSVLEDRRTLFVTEQEKEYVAHDSFRIVATMNPSGDYGKREISPALRNRFTEIYFELEKSEYYEIFDRMISKIFQTDIEFYKARFRSLTCDYSVRKIELIIAHITNLVNGVNQSDIYTVNYRNDKYFIWNDVLELLGLRSGNEYVYKEEGGLIGVEPYYLYKKNPDAFFCFDSVTARINLQRIIRSLSLGSGMLLEGEPGVGKTSIVQNIARMLGVPILRINLSEQTEMSDLSGTYLPIGSEIKFVESEMVQCFRNGTWVLLDEINLCTQSVIEGLNSVLDHRRMLMVDGKEVRVHENTRIFGTMNPSNHLNGRKQLPKSFRDRFIEIIMKSYTVDDIGDILRARYGESYILDSDLSLRGNVKLNEIEKASINISDKFEYFVDETHLRIGRAVLPYHKLDESYVLVHSQLCQLELLIKCFQRKIPVILNGSTGKMSLLRFLGGLFNLNLTTIDCHKETDTCDLLGQYQKAENGDSLFEWCDSHLVASLNTESLIIFNMPELVDKCVFDRLSSLFETDRYISVFEKGIDTSVTVNEKCRFCLCCDTPLLLSPALLDRCVIIDMDETYSYIDLYKIFHPVQNPEFSTEISKKSRWLLDNSRFRSFCGIYPHKRHFKSDNMDRPNWLDIFIRKSKVFNEHPSILIKPLPIWNAIKEDGINQLFTVSLRDAVCFDRELLAKYKYVKSFSSSLPSNLKERITNLKNKPLLSTFIKCLDYSDISFSEQSRTCFNIPSNMKELKISLIKDFKHKNLKHYGDIVYFIDNIKDVPGIKDVSFDEKMFFMTDEDPLLLIRTEIENEKIFKENQILTYISEVTKNLYKYGNVACISEDCKYYVENIVGCHDGDVLKGLIDAYDQLIDKYACLIREITRKLNRDYRKFREIFPGITFCEYCRNEDLRKFLDGFGDIFDFYLVHLFKTRHSCTKCFKNPVGLTTCDLSMILYKLGKFTKCTKNEYSKYVYSVCMGLETNPRSLVFEAIAHNEPMNSNDLIFYDVSDFRDESKVETRQSVNDLCQSNEISDLLQIPEDLVDLALQSIIPCKTTAQAIETRSHKVVVGRDFKGCRIVDECSIFSSVEFLIEKLHAYKI